MELKGSKGRGGARAGAGRKPTIRGFSEAFRRRLIEAAKCKEAETGNSVFDEFVDGLYDRGMHPNARVGLFKIWAEIFVTKQTRQVVEKIEHGPQIGLPPVMEIPEGFRRKKAEDVN